MQSITTYFSSLIPLEPDERAALENAIVIQTLRRKDALLNIGEICTFVAFIEEGVVRHYHVDEQGNEKTCDINMEGNWVTDAQSFARSEPAQYCLQALTKCRVAILPQRALQLLYQRYPKFETISRMINERVLLRLVEISSMLILPSPEERYERLLLHNRRVFEQVPRKYVAHLIGIAPESLSRLSRRMLEKQIAQKQVIANNHHGEYPLQKS